MVYTLLIADDDAMIRKGLTNLIPWAELGFELVDVLCDGTALMQKLSVQPVDVVLTDIRMHEGSGLMVARKVFEQRLPTRIVILSGYSEFEYAQEALRYGVKEYLLKPISIDALRETFVRIKAELDRETKEKACQAHFKSYAEELAENMDALFVGDICAGLLSTDSQFSERIRLNGWKEAELLRRSLLIEVACPSGEVDLLENSLRLVDDGCSFYLMKKQSNKVEGLLLEKRRGMGQTLDNVSSLQDNLRMMTGIHLEIVSSCRFDDLYQLRALKRTLDDGDKDDPVAQACAYIRAHYAQNITLNDVSAALFVNPSYLSRVFHEKTGRTFTETLTRIRLDAAIDHLKKSDIPISDIARLCGYANSKYFYKQFKRHMGISPGEWRFANQKRGER